MTSYWKFAKIEHIEDYSFNKVLEKFYSFGIPGLVRENIQNSLDGKLTSINDPVEVKIEIGTIRTANIPGIHEVFGRVKSLIGKNNYTRETISHMIKKINQESCSYITFEDLNTKGLKGALEGQSSSKENSYSAYAYNKGVHVEEEDREKEKSRGGSHGIGKIASNAASDLFTMFFANCDEDGNQHLGGTVQLIEHEYEGQCYRSTGYFTDEKEGKFYPFENTFDGVFKKKERGLKIIIPFLREQFNNEEEIIRAVCDNFFLSIIEQKLIVTINEKVINKETIKNYIEDVKYYKDQKEEDIKKIFTPLYLKTYMNQKPEEIRVSDKNTEYSFKLYFNYDERIQKGRVAVIRTIGMKIEDMKVKGNATKPFNAVLIPCSVKEDEFLKSLENESHTELSAEHFKDKDMKSNATRFINNLSRKIADIISNEMMKKNPTNGKMDTSDILYNTEVKFKQELEKTTTVINIKKGKGGKSQEIVKIEDGKQKRSKGEDSKKDKPKKQGEPKQGASQRKMKKVQKDMDDGRKKIFLKVEPSSVSRGFIGDKERIKLDLSQNREVKNAKKCDLSLAVVDGMGTEHLDEFKLTESYIKIVDENTGKELKVHENSIKNVTLNDGIVRLSSQIGKKYNKTLKFVYLMEA